MSRKAALQSQKIGLGDFSLITNKNKLRLTKHALQRCKDRNVTVEDALSEQPHVAIPIIKGNTLVTVLNRNQRRSKYRNVTVEEDTAVKIQNPDPQTISDDALSENPHFAIPRNTQNTQLNHDGHRMFLTKVKCTTDHLIGHVIGKGGYRMRLLEGHLPNTTIRFKSEDHSFHIWSKSQPEAKFIKDFLTKQLSSQSTKGLYPSVCFDVSPNSSNQDYFHEAQNVGNRFGVAVIYYGSNVFIVGRRKDIEKAKQVLNLHESSAPLWLPGQQPSANKSAYKEHNRAEYKQNNRAEIKDKIILLVRQSIETNPSLMDQPSLLSSHILFLDQSLRRVKKYFFDKAVYLAIKNVCSEYPATNKDLDCFSNNIDNNYDTIFSNQSQSSKSILYCPPMMPHQMTINSNLQYWPEANDWHSKPSKKKKKHDVRV